MTTTTAAQMVEAPWPASPRSTPQDAREESTSGDAVGARRVREPIEWEEHIEGAVQVPRGILEFQADPASPAHNPALEPDRRVIVARRGGTRATLAAATLMDLGFTDVVNLVGGMNAWKKAGSAHRRGTRRALSPAIGPRRRPPWGAVGAGRPGVALSVGTVPAPRRAAGRG